MMGSEEENKTEKGEVLEMPILSEEVANMKLEVSNIKAYLEQMEEQFRRMSRGILTLLNMVLKEARALNEQPEQPVKLICDLPFLSEIDSEEAKQQMLLAVVLNNQTDAKNSDRVQKLKEGNYKLITQESTLPYLKECLLQALQ
eukprot:CAMPEP_0168619320 /NCGR_PEP_ID=MMETSP0449_2-20121227/6537_1 /TAXON_ID=1082188 /ORGANISM="Strombidium rassoulzadegani, Strain ras09" /LENGTH=143 /DNA_ID=CAMNT_0008660243 /DNA_START=13 /DNA_END=444 /DNA_ORIENTATION=-